MPIIRQALRNRSLHLYQTVMHTYTGAGQRKMERNAQSCCSNKNAMPLHDETPHSNSSHQAESTFLFHFTQAVGRLLQPHSVLPLAPFRKTSALSSARNFKIVPVANAPSRTKRGENKDGVHQPQRKNFLPGCFVSFCQVACRACSRSAETRVLGPVEAHTRTLGHCSRLCAKSRCVFPPQGWGGWRQ